MVPTLSDWTIVAVGQWNPAIFSPDWVGRTLLGVENLETALAFGPAGSAIRYQTPNLIVMPHRERLVIGVRNVEEATLREMERVSRTTLELLSHTPVRALGINFGFRENEPPREMLRTFDLNDTGALADAGHTVQSTEIMRMIEFEPATLKLKMTLSEGSVKFHFNYSHEVPNAREAAGLLTEGRVLDYRNRTLTMLTNVFHLQPQEVA